MKPILFNTDMVRAILDGCKSVTRRVIKFPEGQTGRFPNDSSRDHLFYPGGIKYPPYCHGDILYVRETWSEYYGVYIYKTHCRGKKVLEEVGNVKILWHPSIHMPKEAARLFLRVTGVRVERVQDISEEQARSEGCTAHGGNLAVDEFEVVWNSTIKKADLPCYGWDANPWVWVIEFERISEAEAQKGGEGDATT